MENIVFTLTLSDNEWDPIIGGWRCPALKIPSSKVTELYYKGEKVDNSKYREEKETAMIRWSSPDQRLETIGVQISIKEQLSTLSETKKWKISTFLSAAVAILCAIIAMIGNAIPYIVPKETSDLQIKLEDLSIKAAFLNPDSTYTHYLQERVVKEILEDDRVIFKDGDQLKLKLTFNFSNPKFDNYIGFKFSISPSIERKLGGALFIEGWTKYENENETIEYVVDKFDNRPRPFERVYFNKMD
ncbi:MAG: hypothetical protein EPGJADBJ_03977 [Saprospiraceae bacterium]|nr:hypothetical protein [Saprospiraceae bacterium]